MIHEMKQDEDAFGSRKASSSQFPIRLHDMLDQAEANGYQHIVSWLPEGDGFQIHDPEAMLHILQRMGFNQSKWKSFLRQLQNYGFRRESRGPNKGKCTHDHFIRGRRELTLAMRRIKRSTSAEGLSSSRLLRNREDSTSFREASFNASWNSSLNSFQSNSSLISQQSSSGSRTGLNHSTPLDHGYSNQNDSFDLGHSSNPLLDRFYEGNHGSAMAMTGTNRNVLTTDTQHLIWDIQNELAKLSTESAMVQKPTATHHPLPPRIETLEEKDFVPLKTSVSRSHPRPLPSLHTSSFQSTGRQRRLPRRNDSLDDDEEDDDEEDEDDLDPLDFRVAPVSNDPLLSLVEQPGTDLSSERMSAIFLSEPTLEEMYDSLSE